MTSREIRDLSPVMQALFNRFNDRVRRDQELQKEGISIILTCTYRSESECNKIGERGKPKISRIPSEAFEIAMLKYGLITMIDKRIVKHAQEVGLEFHSGSFTKAG